jgi:hypothetical protein
LFKGQNILPKQRTFHDDRKTAEIMVHPVLKEIRLLSNIGHLEKKYSSQHGGPRMPDRAVLNLAD